MGKSEHEAATEAKRIPTGAYVDREQHERLAALAERNERSLSAEVRLALREHLEREAQEVGTVNDVRELERGILTARDRGDTATLERLQERYRNSVAVTRISGPDSISLVERSQSVIAAATPTATGSSGTIPTIWVRPEARRAVLNLGLTPERESGGWLVGWEDRDAAVIVVETVWPGRSGSDGFEGESRTYRFDASQLAVVDERAHRCGWKTIGDFHTHPQAGAGRPRGPLCVSAALCMSEQEFRGQVDVS